MGLNQNTWKLNQWYDQDVAGNVSYTGAGKLWGWGSNDDGSLGLNDRTDRSSPTQVPGNWGTKGDAGYRMAGAVKGDGTLWMWGYNQSGEFGQNNVVTYSSPIQIPGTTWATLSFGSNSATMTKTDGTMWSVGRNHLGQLGNNSNANRSSPIQIPGTTWSSTYPSSASYRGAVAQVKTDGTLWAWGYNNYGEQGNSDRTQRSSPTQVGTDTTWLKMGAHYSDAMAAIKTDGTLWLWGRNNYGSIGDNTAYNQSKSSPTQIYGGGTDWKNVASGNYTSIATKTDGTLWIWGDNRKGALGLNGPVNAHKSSPVQVPGTTWDDVSGGQHFVAAIKTDGTMWAWGNNEYGTLGQNNLTDYSSPVQIPGTGWVKPFATRQSGGALKSS